MLVPWRVCFCLLDEKLSFQKGFFFVVPLRYLFGILSYAMKISRSRQPEAIKKNLGFL